MSDDLEEVKNIIPHREPFLFIDRIIERGEDSIVTEREVRSDEPQFQGHYPDSPLMPGVLLCEACFQTGAMLLASRDVMWAPRPHLPDGVNIRYRGRLPHWEKDSGTYFVTWRLADSFPDKERERIRQERLEIVKAAEAMSRPLSDAEKLRLERLHTERIEQLLNAGYGSCSLSDDRCAGIVVETLEKFDGERYDLHAWVVMPNHVHVVFQAKQGHSLSSVLHSWKSFTAKACNKILARTGKYWMDESFDRLVRDSKEHRRFVEYVLDNPSQARLKDWKWVGGSAGEAPTSQPPKKPVLTRILEAKFRGMVVPGDVMRIEVSLDEKMGEAFVMSGKILVNSKVVLRVKFIVAMVELADK